MGLVLLVLHQVECRVAGGALNAVERARASGVTPPLGSAFVSCLRLESDSSFPYWLFAICVVVP